MSKSLGTKEKNRLKGFHLQTLGLHNVNWLAIQLHNTLALFTMSNGNSSLLQSVRMAPSTRRKYQPYVQRPEQNEQLQMTFSDYTTEVYNSLLI